MSGYQRIWNKPGIKPLNLKADLISMSCFLYEKLVTIREEENSIAMCVSAFQLHLKCMVLLFKNSFNVTILLYLSVLCPTHARSVSVP